MEEEQAVIEKENQELLQFSKISKSMEKD